jgi:hypothetical protein
MLLRALLTASLVAAAAQAQAADQTIPGEGIAEAASLAQRSPLVTSAVARIQAAIAAIADARLREQTAEVLFDPKACIEHRIGLTGADKQAILDELSASGLIAKADSAAFPGGAMAGVFPPVLDDGTPCPRAPEAFDTAPGSVFGGHHSYPGGLAVHESFNFASGLSFARNYRLNVGTTGADGLPRVAPLAGPEPRDDLEFAQDWLIAAPLWHDWAKRLVFQWNGDGTEFAEFNFGGNGTADNYGAAGDSRTGGHHIIGVAEAIARRLPAGFIVAQASAHAAPAGNDEFKVVNWLRAGAIIARQDPVALGLLVKDAKGRLRLPPVRAGDSVDFLAAGQNYRAEYGIHNLSDADYILSGPAVGQAQTLLAAAAAAYGYDPADTARYNTHYRNPALAYLSAERLMIRYASGGMTAVKQDLDKLRAAGVI